MPRIELRIIGAGEERDRSDRAARQAWPCGEAVTFSDGFVPVRTVPGLIADADVGIVPLRISSGTDIMLPTKLLEYVTVGIPCIVPEDRHDRTLLRRLHGAVLRGREPRFARRAMVELYRDPISGSGLRSKQASVWQDLRWSEHKKVYTELVDRLLWGK